jgi:hypothetical protein
MPDRLSAISFERVISEVSRVIAIQTFADSRASSSCIRDGSSRGIGAHAMEGELAQLEADWREAEEIASIADNMFVPHAVSDFIQRHRAKT